MGKGGGNHRLNSPYLLSGLLRCDECGANFVMSTRKGANGKRYGYYRCSFNANRGKSVCSNSRMVSQRIAEAAVLDAVADKLLIVEVIEGVLEEERARAAEKNAEPEELKRIRASIDQAEKEIANLAKAIRLGDEEDVEELVKAFKEAKSRRAGFEAEAQKIVRQLQPVSAKDLDASFVQEVIQNLRTEISRVSPAEQKVFLKDLVHKIRIPRKGEALLEVDRAGLIRLSGGELCIELVTPRGVEPPSLESGWVSSSQLPSKRPGRDCL